MVTFRRVAEAIVVGCGGVFLPANGNAVPLPAAVPARWVIIASCSLREGKTAEVMRSGSRFAYVFGHETSPEIRISGDAESNTVFKFKASFPRAGWTQIRFTNGSTSYLMFHYFNLGNYIRNYEGATDQSGLIVFLNGHKLSAHLCKTGKNLEDDNDLVTLPDDPEDHSDDIIDDVERRR